MKTTFYSSRNKDMLLSEIKRGNKKAKIAVLAELKRLESRIAELERDASLFDDIDTWNVSSNIGLTDKLLKRLHKSDDIFKRPSFPLEVEI